MKNKRKKITLMNVVAIFVAALFIFGFCYMVYTIIQAEMAMDAGTSIQEQRLGQLARRLKNR